MVGDSWTHKIARVCISPLIDTPITPNHITILRLITGLIACGAFALKMNILGGIIWLISTFLDRADGELARASNKISAWGHKFDYYTDTFITALFFLAIGINYYFRKYYDYFLNNIIKIWSLIFIIVTIDLIFETIVGFNLTGNISPDKGRLSGFLGEELKIGNYYFGFILITLSYLLLKFKQIKECSNPGSRSN